jgi:hypothetical protein
MAKHKKVDFCPVCGKVKIFRDPCKINYDAGGYTEKCPYCGKLLWVPADENQPIELVVISVSDFPEFEPEEIYFDEEKKLLKAVAREEIDVEHGIQQSPNQKR